MSEAKLAEVDFYSSPAVLRRQMVRWIGERDPDPDRLAEDDAVERHWARTSRALFEARMAPEVRAALSVDDRIWQATPIGQHLWCIRRPEDELTAGGLIVPETSKGVCEEGWILQAGPLVTEPDRIRGQFSPYANPLDLVGRRIFWTPYMGFGLAFPWVRKSPYVSVTIADVLAENFEEWKPS